MRIVLGTLVALLAWVALSGYAQFSGSLRSPLAPRGDTPAMMAALAERAQAGNVGNLALVLLEDGRVFGAQARSIGAPVDQDTAFQVASLSKWITAWGVMALVERGALDLDAPISRYLTRWHLPESAYDLDRVTLRRVMSHTAGFTDGLGYQGFAPGTPIQTLEASLTQAADAMPHASGALRVGLPPGEQFRYSGGGFSLIQLLVEEVSGSSFEDFMQQTVLRPLGMTHSTFVWRDQPGADLAVFYDTDGTPAIHYRFTALAAASLYTTAADLTRFLQAHLPGPKGEPIGRGVLTPATLERMRQPEARRFVPIWGLGTILYARNGTGGFVIGHDGSNAPAINTAARLDPSSGDGIIVLESGSPTLATELADEWVFWQTGNLSIFSILTGAKRMITIVGAGCLAILFAGGLAFSRSRLRGD